MENVKFIKQITDYIEFERAILGNCVYYNSANGNKVKLWCEERSVEVKVINMFNGCIDTNSFPFANYFKPTRCSANAPSWTQRIDNGKWYFSDTYSHVLPTESDYRSIADALSTFIEMYCSEKERDHGQEALE